MEGPRGRTLRKALEILGSEEHLARSLGIPLETVRRYLTDGEEVPQAVFIKALDIVARAPRGPKR